MEDDGICDFVFCGICSRKYPVYHMEGIHGESICNECLDKEEAARTQLTSPATQL